MVDKKRKTFIELLFEAKKVIRNSHDTISKTKMLEILDNQVFNDYNFKRHLKEVSIKLEIQEDIVASVIKHYIVFISLEMIKIRKIKTRIVIYGFFFLDIIEPYYSATSKYYKKTIKKRFPKIKSNVFNRIVKSKINEIN